MADTPNDPHDYTEEELRNADDLMRKEKYLWESVAIQIEELVKIVNSAITASRFTGLTESQISGIDKLINTRIATFQELGEGLIDIASMLHQSYNNTDTVENELQNMLEKYTDNQQD